MFSRLCRRSLWAGAGIAITAGPIYYHDRKVMRNLSSKYDFDKLFMHPPNFLMAHWLKTDDNIAAKIKYIPKMYIDNALLDKLDIDLLIKWHQTSDNKAKIRKKIKSKIEVRLKGLQSYENFETVFKQLPSEFITETAIKNIPLTSCKPDIIAIFSLFERIHRDAPYGDSRRVEIKSKMKQIINNSDYTPTNLFKAINQFDTLSDMVITCMIESKLVKNELHFLNKLSSKNVSNQRLKELCEADDSKIFQQIKSVDNEWKKRIFDCYPKEFYSKPLKEFDGMEIPPDMFNKYFGHIEFYQLGVFKNSDDKAKNKYFIKIVKEPNNLYTFSIPNCHLTKSKIVVPDDFTVVFKNGTVELYFEHVPVFDQSYLLK